MKFLPAIFFLLLLAAPARAAEATPRILLVGDSWVQRAFARGAFQGAMDDRGLSRFEVRGSVTAIGGSRASEWSTPAYLERITRELEAHPSIDIVHLSLGGNDLIQDQPDSVWEAAIAGITVLLDIHTVVQHVHALRPDARVVYATYDFLAVRGGMHLELALQALAVKVWSWFDRQLYLLNNLGVLHHAFGYPGAFAPGERALPGGFPFYWPLVGGDTGYPASPDVFVDEIHPSTAGFRRLARHAIDEFYAEWLTAGDAHRP